MRDQRPYYNGFSRKLRSHHDDRETGLVEALLRAEKQHDKEVGEEGSEEVEDALFNLLEAFLLFVVSVQGRFSFHLRFRYRSLILLFEV